MPNYLQENLIISGFIKINNFFFLLYKSHFSLTVTMIFFSLLSHDINLIIHQPDIDVYINEKVIT